MAQAIDIRELRRHEVGDALMFGATLGVVAEADGVRWTNSLVAKRDDELIGVAVTAPDATGTLRVWVAVDAGLEGRDELIGRLIDKAMFKLASAATGACALVVCGEDGESATARACWHGDEPDGSSASVAGGAVRSLDEVLGESDGLRAGGADAAENPAQAA
ncbi:MAG: hypothetical protein AAFY08_03515 [Planctomycetota bacterium]